VVVVPRGHRGASVRPLLFPSTGRRLVTYAGLRNDVEARCAVAGAGDVGGDPAAT
jgi:hypothetical protein